MPARAVTPAERAEWERLFHAGASREQISRLTGRARSTISENLRKRGIRSQPVDYTAIIEAALKLRREQKMEGADIARKLGLNYGTFTSILSRAGVHLGRLKRKRKLKRKPTPEPQFRLPKIITPEELSIRRLTMHEVDRLAAIRRLRLEQDGRA